MQVYLPATLDRIALLVDTGSFSPVSRLGFGITPHLREIYSYEDDEELSEVAFDVAADGSLRLLAAQLLENSQLPEHIRRVVVQAEVGHYKSRYDLDDSAVEILQKIVIDDVIAVYVDLSEAEESVRSAALAIDEADLGQEQAQFIVNEVRDHRLAWYAVQEVPFLLDLID